MLKVISPLKDPFAALLWDIGQMYAEWLVIHASYPLNLIKRSANINFQLPDVYKRQVRNGTKERPRLFR